MRRAELLRPSRLVGAGIVLQWLVVVLVWSRADGVDVGAAGFVNVLLVGPVALAAAFVAAERLGGIALGVWTLLVWILLPVLMPFFAVAAYDVTLRDRVLPHAVGLTGERGVVEGAVLLVALALLLLRRRIAVAAGALLVAGVLMLWLTRLPPPDLSRTAFDAAMGGLREYFWSQRVLQWIPLAGVVAVARRAPAAAAALAGWFFGYAVLRLAAPGAAFDDGELFRRLLPALPAYVLLASALPLLVPTLAARLGPLARPAGTS